MSQARSPTRARVAAEHPLHSPNLVKRVLAYIAPSVMVRSTSLTFRAAIKQLHNDVLKQKSTAAADAVASVSLLQWALRHRLDKRVALRCCVRRGNLNLFCLVKTTHSLPLQLRHARLAAEHGHLHMLKWLRQNGCEWDPMVCGRAAKNGHLEVLQWARANGCPWDARTCTCAAEYGHLEVLQWARANGCPWDDQTGLIAAGCGRLAVLQWMCAKGGPTRWDARLCSEAAAYGHLEVLQWLRANGCPWDEFTCMNAATNGKQEVLAWAQANGCNWNGQLGCKAC
eukprot:TRINITY_DN4882_c0_g1_i3.p1 TRINITY_DN4882_c0_g1~~TRINITY_DN4882_c0_g1_i3.p1  ORF type:complete len:284 (-),score=32.97 TRINITY_DN4882_c0_g1_i3:354-1205(-)